MSKEVNKRRGLGGSYVALAIGLSGAWLICLSWLGASLHPPAIWARLYELRMASANEIGDFVAGAFAPIGVVWLIVTVLQQRAAVADARAEFEESQKATYFVALFDKRYEVLQQVRKVLGDEPTSDSRVALGKTTEMAALLFGTDVPKLLRQYHSKFLRYAIVDIEIGRLERAKVIDADAIARFQAEQSDIVVWLFDPTNRAKLDDAMFLYLKAPAF
ncbi:hypothetical protein [Rhizobium herbae]